MKQNPKYKDYMVAGLTGFLMIAASIAIYFLFAKISVFLNALKKLVDILAPFLMGFLIAYLLAPLYNYLLRNLRELLGSVMRERWSKSISTVVSVLACILTGILVISGLFALVVPRFVESISGIINALPTYLTRIEAWSEDFLVDYPDVYQNLEDILNNLYASLANWASSTLRPLLEDFSGNFDNVSSIVSTLFSGLMAAVTAIKNLVLGFIVAAYLLVEKTTMIGQVKQMTYALLGPKRGNKVVYQMRYTNQVMGGFIRGKLLDSLIIGIICFIGVSIMRMPYPTLISVIIGVTNIIPFFGPFLGAIPCAVLILMYSPIQAVYFAIFILILQQFDGNILGPKILGNTTGLSSFWVLFSIIFFGGLFGFAGMLLGVPLFAVIYSLVSDFVSARLSKRKLSLLTEDYINLDEVEQQPDGEYKYPKVKDPTRK
ncbi:MAG: AI-2E family transporter [Clostridiales bacterium]|nr:AI-2E family transporter [Clostridiales bacterium]